MTPDTQPSSVPQAAIPADPALADPQDTPKPAAALSKLRSRARCPYCGPIRSDYGLGALDAG